MIAIFKREFKAYFTSPIGYIFLAAIWFIGGFQFATVYSYGVPAVPEVLNSLSWILLLVISVIVMRTFSEERGKKIDQLLLTAPIKLSAIVFGKFFAAMSLYAISMAPSLIYQLIMVSKVKSTGFASYFYMLFGMMLFGAILISLGMFISSLTESPALAGVVTEAVNLMLLFMPNFSQTIQDKLSGTAVSATAKFNLGKALLKLLNGCVSGLNITERLDHFTQQVFSVADV
ncbi:MAG: ABC transporter permease, partial [Clostridia bacterium]|nr:ABC transporter permease [Clostridia bacterium]